MCQKWLKHTKYWKCKKPKPIKISNLPKMAQKKVQNTESVKGPNLKKFEMWQKWQKKIKKNTESVKGQDAGKLQTFQRPKNWR